MSKIQTLDLKIIDLTAARDTVRLDITRAGYQGFFADYRTNGEALLHINESAYSGFPIKAQVGLAVGINELFITNAAQPGKTLYLWLSKDATFLQANQDITNIGSLDLLKAITPPKIGNASYLRATASAALGTIVTPAANTAGVRVTGVQAGVTTLIFERIMIKTSAPTAWNDAAAVSLLVASNISGTADWGMQIRDNEFIVPAGFGIYEQASGAGGSSLISITYEVL